MIVPNAAAQLVAGSFRSAMRWAVAIAVTCAVGGVVLSYFADTPSGGTIVCLAIVVFLVAAVTRSLVDRLRRPGHREAESHPHEHGPDCGHEAVPHGDHVDYVHDGHRHAPHEGHYDEHAAHAAPTPAQEER
jgi:zinc transport system permease protein